MLTNEDHLIFRARTSVAAQAALHKADRRDARVMDGLRNSLPLGDVKHEVWALQAAPLEDVRSRTGVDMGSADGLLSAPTFSPHDRRTMTLDKAIAVLGEYYDPETRSLKHMAPYVSWRPDQLDSTSISLRGWYTADELEAMAVVMRAAG